MAKEDDKRKSSGNDSRRKSSGNDDQSKRSGNSDKSKRGASEKGKRVKNKKDAATGKTGANKDGKAAPKSSADGKKGERAIPQGKDKAEFARERRVNRVRSIVDRLMNKWTPETCQMLFTDMELIELSYRAKETFWSQPTMINVEAKDKTVNIVGDIHGQFLDLQAIFRHVGMPPANKFVFLGDYVDRGPFQLEVIMLLFALKVLYPDDMTLLRGNHESLGVNYGYGFYHECSSRYPENKNLYFEINNTFYTMPFVARIEDSILCMHGGISEDLTNFAQLELLARPCDIPDIGLLSDLTWADPEESATKYVENPRGAGHLFGPDQLKEFNERMGLSLIVRAHQVPLSGYQFLFDRQLITVFSAPRYNGQFDNDGCVMQVKRENKKLKCSLTVFRLPELPLLRKADKSEKKKKDIK